jgi:hypothetical protein
MRTHATRTGRSIAALLLLPLLSLPTGCVVAIGNTATTDSSAAKFHGTLAPRTALIHHVVFIRLQDPADTDALIADCDRLLPTIPGVVRYWRGTHFDMGRANVIGDYSVGLEVAFETREAYRTYLEHPQHIELVETWKPRWSGATIYDVWDPGSPLTKPMPQPEANAQAKPQTKPEVKSEVKSQPAPNAVSQT